MSTSSRAEPERKSWCCSCTGRAPRRGLRPMSGRPTAARRASANSCDELHRRGQLLGVYCSGLGFTEQSNLIAEYNLSDRISSERLDRGFCLAPGGKLIHSRICTGQRSGYDICPASEVGKKLLDDRARAPACERRRLRAGARPESRRRYVFLLRARPRTPARPGFVDDQRRSRELLDGWKKSCPDTLLGCESAAAEPYIADLRLSDCRYELCYFLGSPIPLYAFLYHPLAAQLHGQSGLLSGRLHDRGAVYANRVLVRRGAT